MPCAEGLHLWHKLPAPTGQLLLLLAENTTTGQTQMLTGYFDNKLNLFISALPTKRPIESEHVAVTRWAPIRILPPTKKRRR